MRILILGCGWLASAFAMEQRLRGHEVWASTTNKEKYHRLKNDGIFSFIADFDRSDFRDSVAIPREFDFVLNSVPASQKNDLATLQNRFLNIQSFLSNLRWNKHVFLSSVGIYPDQDGWFDEKYNERSKLSEKLLVAEELMLNLSHTCVYRLGGLFGRNRIFARYFSNRVCTTAEQVANFVHLEDVIRLVDLAMVNDLQHPVYNVVAPMHPAKKEVILASAGKYGFELPVKFETVADFQKMVSGELLSGELNYRYIWPDPVDF